MTHGFGGILGLGVARKRCRFLSASEREATVLHRQDRAADSCRRIAGEDGVAPVLTLVAIADLDCTRLSTQERVTCGVEISALVRFVRSQLHMGDLGSFLQICKQLHHLIVAPFGLQDLGQIDRFGLVRIHTGLSLR